METTTTILSGDEPSPVEILRGHEGSPFLITVDHAGCRIPRSLGALGVAEDELRRHIAWDIGALGLGKELAPLLGATLISQRYSRLVIDCNRPLDAPTLCVTKSEETVIPGNLALSEGEKARRVSEIFVPYHEAIAEEVRRRESAASPFVFVALHSFTPAFRGVTRSWHAGVLYQRDVRYAHAVLARLRAEEGLVVGDNEPYSVSDDSDYGVLVYGERRGHLHVELEVRQDLIESVEGQVEWAERLRRVLTQALADLGS